MREGDAFSALSLSLFFSCVRRIDYSHIFILSQTPSLLLLLVPLVLSASFSSPHGFPLTLYGAHLYLFFMNLTRRFLLIFALLLLRFAITHACTFFLLLFLGIEKKRREAF